MVEATEDRESLRLLLQGYNEHPEQRQRIEGVIEEKFRRTVAVLVVDTSGFTRTTRLHGVVHFLALLERLTRAVTPVMVRCGGQFLKAEADNLFGIFPDVDSAVTCVAEICQDLAVANQLLPAADEVYASFGIGYGSLLVIGGDDVYGDEMNLACKLGEDLAERGEVLLTQAAFEGLQGESWRFQELRFSVAGLGLTAHRLLL